MKMKLKLFLIITALLASYPAAFAESSDIFFTDDAYDEAVFDDIALENVEDVVEFDMLDLYEEAQLNGEAVAWDGVTLAEPEKGEDGAYEIYNGAQLAWIAEQVNSQRDSLGKYSGMNGVTIRLVEDIDLGGQSWTPIGCEYDKPFAGELDGNGHTVLGLDFNAADFTNSGLFGCVLGSVHDLKVVTAETGITTQRHVTPSGADPTKYGVGIVAGSVDERLWNYDNKVHSGSIERCIAAGTLTVSNSYGESIYIGGVAGVNSGGTLIDNVNEALITSESSNKNAAERAFIGGITGCNYGEIANSEDFASGSVGSVAALSANPYVGAVAGGNSGTIRNASYNGESLGIGKYTSAYDTYASIGGIAGVNSGKIESSSFASDMQLDIRTLTDDTQLNIGGIAGMISDMLAEGGIIDECTASGKISVQAEAVLDIGLIAGSVTDENALVTDCKTVNAEITASDAVKTVNAGGIAGETNCVIDGCAVSDTSVSVQGAAPVNVGGIAGTAYNTLTDCEVNADVTVLSEASDQILFAGGIAGRAYGNITRAYYTGGTINGNADLAYTGGIAGYAGCDSGSVLADGSSKTTLRKCRVGADSVVKTTYVSGGIVGSAGGVHITEALSEGTLTADVPAVAGGIAGAASGLEARNCLVRARLETEDAAGAVYVLAGTGNKLSASYLAPTFGENTEKYAVSGSERPSDLTTDGVYVNKDKTDTELLQDGVIMVTDEEALRRALFIASEEEALDFSNVWFMGTASPELQFARYSNALSKMTNATEMELTFHVTLENPKPGQHVYVALYNKDGRFCGTTSAECIEADISGSNIKAEFALTYSYYYWDNPKNFDEDGYYKPADEWIPSEYVPATAKAFTWDKANGLRDLSSVEINSLNIWFE